MKQSTELIPVIAALELLEGPLQSEAVFGFPMIRVPKGIVLPIRGWSYDI